MEDRLIPNKYQQNGQRNRPNNQDRELVNERIHFKEVLLIGPKGESFGIVSGQLAQRKAEDYQMDLVCVSPTANPPVCKILDYGKYKFDKEKKAKDAKKNQKKIVIKEVRFTALTDKHDLETKAKATIKFLTDGNKVKAAVYIKGRMMDKKDLVKETMNVYLDMVKDYCVVEKEPEIQGRDYFIVISPKANIAKKQEVKEDAKNEK